MEEPVIDGLTIAPADRDTTLRAAELLHGHATHHVPRDWNYTRDLGDLRHIRYGRDWTGYDHPLNRARRAVKKCIPYFDGNLVRMLVRTDPAESRLPWPLSVVTSMGWRTRPYAALRALRTRDNLPDGMLDNGGILVHVEETGEYLQMVQPQVGALVAEFLAAEPDHPHARKIAAAINHFTRPNRNRNETTDE